MILLRCGVDFNVLVNGFGVFYIVVGFDFFFNFCFICFLLDYGGDFDILFVDGLMLIYVVVMWNCVNCFKLLIDWGGNFY